MKNYQAPVKRNVHGIVIGIDLHKMANYSNARRDSRIVTIEDVDYKIQQIWFNETQISEFDLEPMLFIGNAVNITVEHRIAGQTGYIDLDGVEQAHKTSVQTGVEEAEYDTPTDMDNLSERAMRNLLQMSDTEITSIIAVRKDRAKMTENRRTDMFRDKQGNRQATDIDSQIAIYQAKLAANPTDVVKRNIQQKLDVLLAEKSGKKADVSKAIKELEAELAVEVLETRKATLRHQIADLKAAETTAKN